MPEIEVASDTAIRDIAKCEICAMILIRIGRERAWWFGTYREVFAGGIRMFGLWHRVPPEAYHARSPLCRGCFRFRKNAAMQGSPLFRWLNARLNPRFNRARNRLLTGQELDHAREFARRSTEPDFQGW